MERLVREGFVGKLESEELIPLAKVKMPGDPATTTRIRWSLHGSRGVILECVVVGARRFTSEKAVSRFIEAVTIAARDQHRANVGATSC